MQKSNEYIYYTITSPCTVKFGASASIENRQKAHYTSSPFLQIHKYKVNDAFRAESELHRIAKQYKLKHGDIINNVVINKDAQLDEHYKLSEAVADKLCKQIQQKFHESKPLDFDRTYCVGCFHVVNISTTFKNDGFRCKRCFEKIVKQGKENNDPMDIDYDCNNDGAKPDDIMEEDNEVYEVYEVKKILDHCVENGKTFYKLQWKQGKEKSWEPAEYLSCPDLLNKYHAQ